MWFNTLSLFTSRHWFNQLSLFAILVLFLIIDTHSEAARTRLKNTLNVKYNVDCHLPQCSATNPNSSAVNLFQVISTNPETPFKTNFIWSNIGGPPMVITTSSSQESNLLIDWESIVPSISNNNNNARNEKQSPTESATTVTSTQTTAPKPSPPPVIDGFHFNVTQDAAFGLLVEKIIFFDDTDKSGLFTKDKPYVEIDWGKVVWDLASRHIYEKDDFLKSHLRMKTSQKIMNGQLWIKLAVPRNYKADRQQEMPHLKLNSQSISIVIIVDGMQPPASYKNARLAIDLVVVVQGDDVSYKPDSKPLISDEYTPGVFRIKALQFKSEQDGATAPSKPDEGSNGNAYVDVEGQTAEARAALGQAATLTNMLGNVPSPVDKGKLGFLYWKEVAYTDRRKLISRTIDVYDNEVKDKTGIDTLPNISRPFYQYFKYQPSVGPKPKYTLYRFNMIFGKGESTYGATNFTDFSFVFGLGAAPQEQVFSFLVKFIIFICFCLPLLVMLAGLGYLMLRRFRRNGDTELLLAAES